MRVIIKTDDGQIILSSDHYDGYNFFDLLWQEMNEDGVISGSEARIEGICLDELLSALSAFEQERKRSEYRDKSYKNS